MPKQGKTATKSLATANLTCPSCEKTFAEAKRLNLHRKLCHESGTKHVCSFCNKSFTVLSNLRRHRRSAHLNQSQRIKGAACHFCDYKCRDQFQLNIHLRRHTQDRPFACQQCQKSFASQADCGRHSHCCRGLPRNVCPTCHQAFKNIQLLNHHHLWDADCGRLRQLQMPSHSSNGDASAVEIFRLQTADSERDIVGARLCRPAAAEGAGNLVAASQRRVKCGVCINCSRDREPPREAGRRCLHPVKYYRYRLGNNSGRERVTTGQPVSYNRKKEEEEEEEEDAVDSPSWLRDSRQTEENVMDSPSWLLHSLDVKATTHSDPDGQEVPVPVFMSEVIFLILTDEIIGIFGT